MKYAQIPQSNAGTTYYYVLPRYYAAIETETLF